MPATSHTTAQHDYLELWGRQGVDHARVRDFLALDETAFARVTEDSAGDAMTPIGAQASHEEIAALCNQVAAPFGGDVHKSGLWFRTSNPLLGDLSPREMIRLGRFRRLRQFVLQADNAP